MIPVWLMLARAWAAAPDESPALNSQLYRPPIDAEATLWADDAGLAPTGYWSARLALSYINDPFVYVDDTDTQTRLVSDAVPLNLLAGLTLSRVRLGVDLPIWLFSASQVSDGGAGLGDLAFDVKGTILNRDEAPLGLALDGRLALNSATVDAPLGASGPTWELSAIADERFGDLLLAVNLGTRGMPEVDLENVTWNDQFFYRIGAGYALNEHAGLSLDLAGQLGYANPLSNGAGSPLEGLVGGWWRANSPLVLRAGVGTGLSPGIGSPDARVLFMVGWEPPRVRDADGDGILDKQDLCPDQPEDQDGYQDTDGCPDPSTLVTVHYVNDLGEPVLDVSATYEGPSAPGGEADGKLALHPGTWTLHALATGHDPVDASFAVPAAVSHEVVQVLPRSRGTLHLIVTDADSAPLPATVRLNKERPQTAETGVLDARLLPNDYSVTVQSPGYLPQTLPIVIQANETNEVAIQLLPARVKATKEKIEIADKVYFETGKAIIKPESFGLLNEVASIIKANPDITMIRIEGHTDSRGSASANLKLSDARAASVKDYLVNQGVAALRLNSIGYGESRPVDPAENAAAWEKNRRVEFFIEKRSEE